MIYRVFIHRELPGPQWKPGFTEVSQFCQGFVSEKFTLTWGRHDSERLESYWIIH